MGLTVAITNMKGGVGKTTLTANLGHCLSELHNLKVLLVDVDPQFNLTQYCVDEKTYEKILSDANKGTVHNIFVPTSSEVPQALGGQKKKKNPQVVHNLKNELYIIPSAIHLIDFIDQRKSGSERLLNNFLKEIKDEYAYILIDCPPTSTILSRAAYLASDAYLIPMGMDYFSVMGLPLLQKDINEFTQTYGSELNGLGIVRTRYLHWSKVARRHKDVVERFSKTLNIPIFDSVLKQRQDIQNALSERKFLLDYKPNSEASRDIKEITKEFLKKT